MVLDQLASSFGIQIIESTYIKRGECILMGGRTAMHPIDMCVLRFGGDLWSRHMPGVREALRDRRLYR